MANLQHGVLLAKTSPAFLHGNSTSHTWVFSAIAELIDNAYDPDVHAKILRIDIEKFANSVTCLTFTDNGCGLSPDKLHNMLSFGYCEKVEVNGHKPVGQYGNGFKSGSMRIGRDAVVFTKTDTTMSVGMLSQTFLQAVGAETILVPIITWEKKSNIPLTVMKKHDTDGSLKSVLGHSLFPTTSVLIKQFELIPNNTGTRIIIYNLKTGSDGKLELDFESNALDILNSEHHEMDAVYRPVAEYTPEYRRSLREYCSILYLKPRMKIVVRGKKVVTKLVAKSLKKTRVDSYQPRFLNGAKVNITFGFGQAEDCGMMMYHRNRLIKAYEKVGCQKQWLTTQMSNSGAGIVGVVEANFLDPIHNKQDFDRTDRYNAFINALGAKLNDYRDVMSKDAGGQSSSSDSIAESNPWTWAQCDKCNKWRRLPPGFDTQLPENWYCYMNRDAAHNRCDIDEEPEDEDAIMEQSCKYKCQVQSVRMQRKSEAEQRMHNAKGKDQALQKKVQQLESEKQAVGNQARVDLEQARLQLEEAQQREAEQRRIIQMLERENRQWKEKQRSLGNDIMANDGYMANINKIARGGHRTPASMSSSSQQAGLPVPLPVVPMVAANQTATGSTRQQQAKKRKSWPSASAPAAKKQQADCANGDVADSSKTAEHASDNECEDDKEAIQRPLIVRLPTQAPNTTSSVIVIDDSDEEEGSTQADVKPDRAQLDNQLNTAPAANSAETAEGSADDTARVDNAETVDCKPPVATLNQHADTSNHSSVLPMYITSSEATSAVPSTTAGPTELAQNINSATQSSKAPSSVVSSRKSTPVPSAAQASSSHSVLSPSASAPERVHAFVNTASAVDNCLPSQIATLPAVQHIGLQTNLGDSLSADSSKLNSLRMNVLQLLKTIVPSLNCENLEFVDDIVIEMVRVNAEEQDIET